MSSEVSVTEEGEVKFNCKGEGMPEVTYDWFYRNDTGGPLRINHFLIDYNCCGVGTFELMDFFMEREFMTGEEEGFAFLSFSEATEEDEGTYICKVTTKLGSAESTFALVVNEPGN